MDEVCIEPGAAKPVFAATINAGLGPTPMARSNSLSGSVPTPRRIGKFLT
jgi:hypothetical protein